MRPGRIAPPAGAACVLNEKFVRGYFHRPHEASRSQKEGLRPSDVIICRGAKSFTDLVQVQMLPSFHVNELEFHRS